MRSEKNSKVLLGRRLTGCLLAILFLGILIPMTVKASSLEDSIKQKQAAISEAQAEKKKLQSGLSDIKAMVKKLEQSKNNLESYVSELDQELTALGEKIEELQEQITEKKAEVEQAKKDTKQAQAVADQQYADMKERLRYLYVNGSQDSYLAVLLTAQSFADMINQAQYVEKLSAYDRRKLLEYRQNVEYLNLCRQTLEEEEAVLAEAEKSLQTEQESVNTLISEKSKEIEAYEANISGQQAEIEDYEAQIAAENATIAELEKAVAAEKAQLAEQNRLKYDGGMFQFPCPGYTRVSSDYGNRMHPTLGVYKFHNGIDLAASTGTPILAAYDGKVVGASYNSTMGNYVMIDHGDGLYTIYMHASKLYVSTGKMVSKGDTIAAVGSTGRSTGPHLHFGVRLNGSYVSPWNYLK